MEGGGAGAQPAETEMAEAAHQPDPQYPQQHPAPQMVAGGMESIPATLSRGGRFIHYNILRNIFERSLPNTSPPQCIGEGAYGIVCSTLNFGTKENVAIKKIANAFDNKDRCKANTS